jgi:xanthine dehydrogenase accessory factor
MATDFYIKAAELASSGNPFAVATVVRVEGSSSAKRGSKALIDHQGKIVHGWVGGGCAESAVRTGAVSCMEQNKSLLLTLDMTDEVLGVGMPCGGKMDVFIEPVLPKPELLIVGHGRIAETLAGIASLVNFTVTVNDPGATREAFPSADRLVTRDLDLSETPIGPNTFVVIATQHKGDHLWLEKALAQEAGYIALIASAHRARLVLDYLLAEGVPAEKVARVQSPAGLDLGAQTPEEIALSILSQIVALRRGGSAKPMMQRETAEEKSVAEPAEQVIRECDTGRAS